MLDFKVLSVEDQEPLRNALVLLLESVGAEVKTAVDGQDGLDVLKRGYRPDVLLVDNHMPVMDGITFIQKVKKHPNYRDISVVFLSAQYESESIITALRFGAIDYITKPYDPEDLFKRLERAYQIGQQLHLASTVDAQYRGLKKNWDLMVSLPYVQFNLTKIEEIESASRFLAGNLPEECQAQVTVGLLEALSNGIIHGNLGISSKIREEKNGYANLQHELVRRATLAEYKDRKMTVERSITEDEVSYTVSDEGEGFDIQTVVDPRKPENVVKKTGRGILLMKVYFDIVEYNDKGNSVVLKKKICLPPPPEEDFELEE